MFKMSMNTDLRHYDLLNVAIFRIIALQLNFSFIIKAKRMKNKSELFKQLPDDCKYEIGCYLSTSSLFKTAKTSKAHWTLFNDNTRPGLVDERKKINKLLSHVVNGEHDEVVSMLEMDISLLYKRGQVIDCSERKFIDDNEISAIEYAFWALDKYMWSAMLGCVRKLEDQKKINEVFQIVLNLYDKVDTKGVSYTLNNIQITDEKHFDFKNTIIHALQMQVNLIKASEIPDWPDINNQWRKGVGGAQRLLVMHVVYEYCSEEPFYPVPKFTSKPKSSKQFVYWFTKENENWFCSDSKLGLDFAIVKGSGQGARRWQGEVRESASAGDLAALKALCEIRTEDFIRLKPQLEKQKTVDTHPQIVQL